MAWVFLLEVLQHMGFGQRWRDWISIIMSTASTRILLNGSPGRRVCHARGLRQGDPLSHMLFVLVMEVLNRLLDWIEHQGYFTPIGQAQGSRVSLYSDDVVIFVKPSERDLLSLKGALNIFGLASGLFSSLDKSVATPIHCSAEDMERVQSILSCQIEPFPCKYLGIPLSVHKLKRSEEQFLANRIPSWKGSLLNAAGRRLWRPQCRPFQYILPSRWDCLLGPSIPLTSFGGPSSRAVLIRYRPASARLHGQMFVDQRSWAVWGSISGWQASPCVFVGLGESGLLATVPQQQSAW